MDINNIVKVDVELEFEDIYCVQKAQLRKLLPPLRLVGISVLFIIFSIAIIFQSINRGMVPIAGLIFILFLIILFAFIPLQLKKQSKIVFETNKLIRETQHFQIDSEGIKIKSESIDADIKWHDIYKAVETKDSFQFFISKQQLYLIPKRYFVNKSDQINIISNYVKHIPIPKGEKKKWRFGSGLILWFYVVLFIIIFFILLIYGRSS